MVGVVSSKRTVIASEYLIKGIVLAEYAVHNQDVKGLPQLQGLKETQLAFHCTF